MTDPRYVNFVKKDFSKLSSSYDLLNTFMSLGTDRTFRYIAIKEFIHNQINIINILDVGTGTGHLANELFRQKKISVIGIDVSLPMIQLAKNRNIYKNGMLNLIVGDANKIPFRKNSFEGIISGFVGRHFTSFNDTLIEHNRALTNNGRIMMLEMGRRATILAPIMDKYIGNFMSILGKLATLIVTGDTAPFRLLEQTYNRFYSPEELKLKFEKSGFLTRYRLGLLGSIVVIIGIKKII